MDDIRRISKAIVVENFLPEHVLDELESYQLMATAFADERNAGIVSRSKWEIECWSAHAELMDFVRSDELRHLCEDWEDLSWRLVLNDEIKTCEMAVSIYEPGCGFNWHVDHIMSDRRRVLNWMLTMRQTDTSYVEWNQDAMPHSDTPHTFTPSPGSVTAVGMEPNRLVLMPSWYPHRIVSKGQRTAFHGHFGI